MCKLHNEVFEVAETRINTECFLPVWEGVSGELEDLLGVKKFPPCMGGCIEACDEGIKDPRVSSLYGRVYRRR